MEHTIKRIRENIGISQKEFSEFLNIPLSTLRKWEQGERVPSDWVTYMIVDKMKDYKIVKEMEVDETHGILSFKEIKDRVKKVAKNYSIRKVYLFGSYVKGEATDKSDIDLFIETDINDMTFFGIHSDFKDELCKNVDLLSLGNIKENSKMHNEILKTGVLIYEG